MTHPKTPPASKPADTASAPDQNGGLTHVDAQGQAHMVDVGQKAITARRAVAVGHITLQPETLNQIAQNQIKKGDVLACARIAGIMAAKQTAQLIPLCHPLYLSKIVVHCEPQADGVQVEAICQTHGQTGVEMEALTAGSVALLTIYDMCKAVDESMTIGQITLAEKTGGRRDRYSAAQNQDSR